MLRSQRYVLRLVGVAQHMLRNISPSVPHPTSLKKMYRKKK